MQTARTVWLLWVLFLFASCSSDNHADSRVPDRGRDGVTVCYRDGSAICSEGDSASCMSAQGTPAYKVCVCGTWTDCTWECKPGSTLSCAGGVQRCIDGKWGACGG